MPEFQGTDIIKFIKVFRPICFEDVVRVVLLAYGSGTWYCNAEELLQAGIPKEKIICSREDVMDFLLEHSLSREISFRIAEFVRSGKASRSIEWQNFKVVMTEQGVPEWFMDSCEKIRYLFPRAHVYQHVLNSWRIGWFKIHEPKAYYAAFEEMFARGYST